MKTKIIYSALGVVGWCLAAYLTGCFVCADFDIRDWDTVVRFITGLGMLSGSLVTIGTVFGAMNTDK